MACRILVTALFFQAAVAYLVTTECSESPGRVLQFLQRATLCGVILALVELVKDMSARLLSLRVHSDSLFEDLEVRPALLCLCLPRGCLCTG